MCYKYILFWNTVFLYLKHWYQQISICQEMLQTNKSVSNKHETILKFLNLKVTGNREKYSEVWKRKGKEIEFICAKSWHRDIPTEIPNSRTGIRIAIPRYDWIIQI